MASNTLDDVARKAMDREIVKAKVTKYSEIFAISMLEKHRRFCRCGLTHLDATPTFKNRPNTYTPCKCNYKKIKTNEEKFEQSKNVNSLCQKSPNSIQFSIIEVIKSLL